MWGAHLTTVVGAHDHGWRARSCSTHITGVRSHEPSGEARGPSRVASHEYRRPARLVRPLHPRPPRPGASRRRPGRPGRHRRLPQPQQEGPAGVDARKEAIAATMAQEDLADTVEVRTLPGGLLVDFCREIGAGAVVRGLRSQLDLAYEEPMARMNRHLAEIDTVFLLTESSLAHISSSLVREVHALGGEVSNMLPGPSQQALVAAPDVS